MREDSIEGTRHMSIAIMYSAEQLALAAAAPAVGHEA